MDDIDEKIIKKINTNQNVPAGFTQSIQKALYKDVKIKNKVVEFTKILATACTTIAIAGGVSFAGYGLYQKIWKIYKKYIKQENTYHILFKITIKNRGLTGNIKIYKKNV